MKTVNDISTWIVLLVDDEPDNLNVVAELLRFYGATVALAENGQRGLEIAAEIKPNLILLDLAMPVMDGWEAQQCLRQNVEFDDVPVVALTALAMAGDEERVMAAGFDGYITKPFRAMTLLDELKALMCQFRQKYLASFPILATENVLHDQSCTS